MEWLVKSLIVSSCCRMNGKYFFVSLYENERNYSHISGVWSIEFGRIEGIENDFPLSHWSVIKW